MTADVAFFANIPNPYNGDLYAGLTAAGTAVEVRYKGEPASEGRPWNLTAGPSERIARSLRSELDVLAKSPPSTIVLTGSWATPRDVARRITSVKAHRRGTRVLVWGEPMSDRGGVRGRLRHLYFHPLALDAVLGIGTHSVESYRAATGGRIPVHVFPYTTNSGLDVAPRISSRPVIGFVGRLVDWKGAHIVIWALHHLAPADRPQLEIVGSGPIHEQLLRLARRLQVDVTFHGEVDKHRLEAIRSRWWMALAPSQEVDGWGLVVPEAMNSSLPVVGSGFVGSAIDMIRDGFNGTLISREKASDPRAWAVAIATGLELDQAELADNAKAVGDAFSARRAAPWLKDLIQSDLGTERSFVHDAWARLGVPQTA